MRAALRVPSDEELLCLGTNLVTQLPSPHGASHRNLPCMSAAGNFARPTPTSSVPVKLRVLHVHVATCLFAPTIFSRSLGCCQVQPTLRGEDAYGLWGQSQARAMEQDTSHKDWIRQYMNQQVSDDDDASQSSQVRLPLCR